MGNWEPHLVVAVDYTEDERGLHTHLRLKNLDGQSQSITVDGCQPRFWSEKDPSTIPNLPSDIRWKLSDLTSITGKELYEIRTELYTDIAEWRDFFYPHYSADVPWRSLVRWLYGWTAVIDVDTSAKSFRPIHIRPSETDASEFQLDVLWFDIETADSLDVDNAPERVVSIAFVDSVTGIHEIGTTAPTSERMVAKFLSSQEALESVVEHTAPIPPLDRDKIKVVNFDHADEDTREAALLWWFKQRVEELDRDLLGGQFIKGYDVPYLRNRCRTMRSEMNSRHRGKVPVHHTYPDLSKALRRPLFDSKIAYAEQVQGAAATTGSGSLAWMAGTVLGYGKVPRTRITDLMVRDPMMLAVYNAWDNVVVERCMDKLKLVDFYLTKTAYHNSTLYNSHSNMMLVEDMMGHLLMDRKIVMPSLDLVRDNLTGSIEQGGHVMDAPVGVYENAMELDNSMEYPACIITGNFSPDTIVNPADYSGEYPFPVCITAANRVYRLDREGIMPSVLRHLATERKRTQTEMKAAYQNGDKELGDVLNRKQRVMKENMNSWYGVLGSGATEKTRNRPFRLANPAIGSDITETARLHNQWNKERIEASSLWFTTDGVLPMSDPDIMGDGIELRFVVIGQDTDSCKAAIVNHDEAEAKVRKFTEDDVRSIGTILCRDLNDSYDDFSKQTLNVDKNEFFLVKPDAFYRRFFSWGVKKRYAYLTFDGDFGFRGVEIRRSSVPTVVKEGQKRLFDIVLNGGSRKEINAELRAIREELLDSDVTPSIHFGQPMGVKKSGTHAHKAAMWSNEHLDTTFDIGDKPVLYLGSTSSKILPPNRKVAIPWGEKPEDFGIDVDRLASFEKHFVDSTSWIGILNALGTSWDSAITGTSQASLDEWFV